MLKEDLPRLMSRFERDVSGEAENVTLKFKSEL